MSIPRHTPQNKFGHTYSTVWSVCFVWPDGAHWNKSPSTYLGCMEEWIKRRRQDTIIVYIHRRMPHRSAISRFLRGMGRAVYVRAVEGHAFIPMTMRFVPLFDADPLTTNAIVIVADIHDNIAIQTHQTFRILKEMIKDRKGFGMTAWRASGNGLPYACDSMKALQIEPCFRFRSDHPDEYHWHIDGGLLMTTPKFRRHVTASFARHMTEFTARHGHTRGADEQVLETFFHEKRMHGLLMRASCAFPHVYRIRDCKQCSRTFEGSLCHTKHGRHGLLFEGAYENENPKPCRSGRLILELVPRNERSWTRCQR